MCTDSHYTNDSSKKKDIIDLYEEANIKTFRSHLINSMNKSLELKSFSLIEANSNYRKLIGFRKKTFRISNRGATKSSICHQLMFEKMTNLLDENSEKNKEPILKIFSHGLKKIIFDNEDVINSFENLATKIYKKNPKRKKELIEIIIKEEENKFLKSISKSEFYKKIKDLEKKFNKKIIKFYLLDPKKKFTPEHKIHMEERSHFLSMVKERYFEIIENKDSIKAKDINTFEIFDGKWVRVRTDNKRKQHSSSALIDCLLPKKDLENIENLFNKLKGECDNAYDVEEALEKII